MATSIPNSSKAIRLKLLVDSQSRKVLFAEAGKEFVDFLFGLVHIPIGSMMGLLWNHGMAGPGSWSRVYESIQDLESTCLHQSKEKFLMPEPAFPSETHPPPLLLNFVPPKQATASPKQAQIQTAQFSSGRPFVVRFAPNSLDLNGSVAQRKETGYIRGVATFMVMDDLTVKPMSTISSITLLNTFKIKDVSLLQEKTVTVDIQKGLELVKASFGSTTVLTDVFLENTGSLSRVYESIQNLDSTCLHQTKEEFLMPEPAFPSDTHPLSLLLNFVPPKQDTTTSVENQLNLETLFRYGRSDLTSLYTPSPFSRSIENRLMVEQHKETGYVKGVVTFMVKDDLTVTPMSTISSITLLNTFNVKDISLLREKMVTVDIETGLELVKASFGSTTVLRDVFLRND